MPTLITRGAMSVQALGFGAPQGGGGGGGWIATWTSNGEFTYPGVIFKPGDNGKFYFLATDTGGSSYYGKFNDTFNVEYAEYTYNFNSYLNSSSIILDSFGNLYSVGSERRTANLESTIIKLDSNGNVVYEYVDSQVSNYFSYFYSASIDSDGNIMCLGSNGKTIPPSPTSGLSFAKFSPSGSLLTFASNDAPTNNYYLPISSNFDLLDKMYVANRIQNVSNAYVASTFLKVDNTGAIIWAKEINGNLRAQDMVAKPDGTFYVTLRNSNATYYLFAVDTNGSILWQKTFDNSGTKLNLSYVAVDAIGNIYINATNGSVQAVIKLDSSGNIVWQKSFDLVYVNSIACDNLGNVYIASAFDYGILLFMKIPSDGNINGTYTINGYPITIADTNFNVTNGSFTLSPFSYGSGTWSYNNTSYSSDLTGTTATIQNVII